MWNYNFFMYILTNSTKKVLYVGVTNDLVRRPIEHREGKNGFTAKYYCHYLIYYEHYSNIEHAIAREKQVKRLEA